YPNRPHNHGASWPFHSLITDLFNPLNESKSKRKPTHPAHPTRRKLGPDHSYLNPHERRRDIVARFISKWRAQVGNDIYPAFRLIIPDRDRDRAMYGLKEKTIAKILIKVMKINRDSEDGQALLNWKLPGMAATAAAAAPAPAAAPTGMAGDFAGRCYEVLAKRPLRVTYGDLSIADVNERLDRLSVAPRESDQLPIFREFYQRMNPEELAWLVRVVLRQMKIGATERTLFAVWHPDAENLFSVSSSLRRVCWELWDPALRLEGDEACVALMQCFQPQLAQFQMHDFERMVKRMRLDPEDPVFWIEEKMDGERMQLHMCADSTVAGGKRFRFWSRKAKEYTYLYGDGFHDENGALTRHLRGAFADGVDSIILDGEMVTWDPEQDAPVPFGTLKTAALQEQRNPFDATGNRPLLRVFDILYLNGTALTRYTLRDRRRALEASVRDVHRRFEIHPYDEARRAADIEPLLRRVVAEASEGLILKNPGSPYRLNERCDDWMKVKPEYMTEFGESLDLVVIGGYYGTGRRGGHLASFLCGLRADTGDRSSSSSSTEQLCYSFCKVGGGFAAQDYAAIRHRTEGKWHEWNPRKPPREFIELAKNESAQPERPDMWIKPADSFVLCVKAAQVVLSDMFRVGLTLRFPRLKMLRPDKDWRSALSVADFIQLKSSVEQERKEKEGEFHVDQTRRRPRPAVKRKKELTVAGDRAAQGEEVEFDAPRGALFAGLSFYIMTDKSTKPRHSKAALESLVKANQGRIVQTDTAAEQVFCIADRKTVRVASLQNSARHNIVRPEWLLDCVSQAETDGQSGQPGLLLPLEPRHMFFTLDQDEAAIARHVDAYNDSYTRDVSAHELSGIMDAMPLQDGAPSSPTLKETHAAIHDTIEISDLASWMFKGHRMYFAPASGGAHDLSPRMQLARNTAVFAGADCAQTLAGPTPGEGGEITHVVVDEQQSDPTRSHQELVAQLRRDIAHRMASMGARAARVVSVRWIEESWKEGTLLDEERFATP
ncbi:DNA ligase (ATP), partial [Ascosphaera acerosa]